MPDNTQELLWWALNGALAIIIFLARNDLKEMKADIKAAIAGQSALTIAIAEMKAKCPRWNGTLHTHRRCDDEEVEP